MRGVGVCFLSFEKGGTYYWQFRATNASAGGTSNLVVSSSVKSVTTKDATTYTWTGGAEGAWEDENNWEASPAVGSFGYPSTSDATAVFAEGTTAAVTLSSTSALTISKVVITNSNVDVTLKKAAGSNGKLTVGSFAPAGAGSVLTLDGLTLQIPSGASVGKNFTLSLVNGAYVDHPGPAPTFENKGGRILLSAGTTFYGQIYKMSNGSLTSISNATLKFYHYVYWDGKGEKVNTIRFEGASPSLCPSGGGNGHQAFAPSTAGSVLNLDFVLPKNGYETAPLRYSVNNIIMGKGDNSQSGMAYVNVIANEKVKVAEDATIPLISWTAKGIDTNVVVKGAMPTKKTRLVYGGESVVTTIGVNVVQNPGVIIFLR